MEFIRTVPAVRYGVGRVAAPERILSLGAIVVNREIATVAVGTDNMTDT
jgi:hypothetical protein